MTNTLLLVLIVLAVVAIVTFVRTERKGQTFKTALHGEVDALKKRMKQVEAGIDGGAEP